MKKKENEEKVVQLSSEIVSLLENNDFSICGDIEKQGEEFVVEIQISSPEGEDVICVIWFDGTDEGFIKSFKKYAEEFDADEHAEMWVNLRGKNGVPGTIRELLDDAEAIKRDLLEMADILINKDSEPKTKKLWARIGMSVECSEEEYERIKTLITSKDSSAGQVIRELFLDRGTIDGDSYMPTDCEDNPNTEDYEF